MQAYPMVSAPPKSAEGGGATTLPAGSSGPAGGDRSPTVLGEQTGTEPIIGLDLHLRGLDMEIIELIRRRVELTGRLEEERAGQGGPRFAHEIELEVFRRYGELGPTGRELAQALLRLGRQARVQSRVPGQRWRGGADQGVSPSRG